MSVKVIELNDSNIKVGNEAGMVFQSPGFSLAVSYTHLTLPTICSV